jgi:hypothetical protein
MSDGNQADLLGLQAYYDAIAVVSPNDKVGTNPDEQEAMRHRGAEFPHTFNVITTI